MVAKTRNYDLATEPKYRERFVVQRGTTHLHSVSMMYCMDTILKHSIER
jgi:hypothetical protein